MARPRKGSEVLGVQKFFRVSESMDQEIRKSVEQLSKERPGYKEADWFRSACQRELKRKNRK